MFEPVPGSAVSTSPKPSPNPQSVIARTEPARSAPASVRNADTRRHSEQESHTPLASEAALKEVTMTKALALEGSARGRNTLAPPEPSAPERPDRADGHRNEVFVVGRVTAAPWERELPSGDRLVTWRICVARTEVPGQRRARADSLTLVSFDPHLCAAVAGWRVGDVVRVTGELRRRIWRGWKGVQSVVEVEVDTAALVRRAGR